MTIASSGLKDMNDKKLYAGKKKKKGKSKKEKSSMPDTHQSTNYQEQITDRSFVMAEADWEEAASDLSFDDMRVMVDKAVETAYTSDKKKTSYGSPIRRYYVYKLWPDKVVLKRSYDNNDGTDDLFLMMSYSIDGDKVIFGESTPVDLGFVPPSRQSSEFLTAVREADSLSIDDPEFAKRVVEENEGDDPDDDDFVEEEEDEEEDEVDEDDDSDSDGDDDDEVDDDEESASADMQESTLREDISNIKERDISESYAFNAIDSSTNIVEAADGSYIIKNMSLLGGKSKNGRAYSKEVRKNAIKVFEGIRAYCNHPAKGKEDDTRMIQELIGRHKNIRFDESTDMLRGDLHLSPTETVREFIMPHVRSNPEIIGNSINASGKLSSDGTQVLEITKGRSVDIVSDPATTNGLYESVQRTITSEGGEEHMEITREAVLKEAKLVEELRAHFREEFDVENSVSDLQEQIESLTEEKEELETVVQEYKLKEQIIETKTEVDQLLKESKLTEDSKADKELRVILESADGTDARKAIIARFEKITEDAKKSVSKGSGKGPSLESTKLVEGGDKLQEANLISRVAAAVAARR